MLALAIANIGHVLMVVLGVGFLIFIHELGHFLAAKWAGVTVEVFSLGFGPRIWGFVRGGTDYRLCAIPIGGYVRMLGEVPGDGDPADPGSLAAKSVGARFLVFSGGVLMNLCFAFVAFPIVFNVGVPFTTTKVGAVEPGEAAWLAGIRKGERVVAVDGKELYSFEQLAMECALAGPEGVEFDVVDEEGARRRVEVFPRYVARDGLKRVGIVPPREEAVLVRIEDPDGPAARAGLADGDRILRQDGEAIDAAWRARRARAIAADPLRLAKPGTKTHFEVERDGRRLEIVVTPELTDGAHRFGIAMLRARVYGVRAERLPGLDLRRGDILLALRSSAGDEVPILGRRSLDDALRTAGAGASFRLLRSPLDAQELGAAAEVLVPLPRAFVGDAGTKRLLAELALGYDELSGRVFVQPGLAAAKVGLRSGDRVLSLGGRTLRNYGDLLARSRAAAKHGTEVSIRWQVTGEGSRVHEAQLRAEPVPELDYGFAYALGPPLRETYRVAGFVASLRAGFVCSVDTIRQLYVTLKRIFSGSVSGRNLGGIIAISQASYDYARRGLARFLYFLAILSLNLAFINVLPIPVLDGGHLLFLVVERIKGSPVSVRVMTYAQVLGLVLVVALLLFVTYNDILRTITNR